MAGGDRVRGSAAGWFAADAERHCRDAPRHCPSCGAAVDGPAGLVVEYWVARDRVFHCWCRRCRWSGDVIAGGGDGPLAGEPLADPDRAGTPDRCPACGASLHHQGRLQRGDGVRRGAVFRCRCGTCGWSGDIVRVDWMIGHEAV